jgi:SEC-C motif
VTITSHDQPFLLTKSFCDNQECTCKDVFLTFTECNESGKVLACPIAFTACIDVETWKEVRRSPHSPQISSWIREFIHECPTYRRAAYKGDFLKAKQEARNKAQYTIDASKVRMGTLISYGDAVAGESESASRRFAYSFEVHSEGRRYLVKDQYCSNPVCDCKSVHLAFFEEVSTGDDQISIHQRFHGQIQFDGQLTAQECDSIPRDRAQAILTEWWNQHSNLREMLIARYQDMKEVGRRSLEADKFRNGAIGSRRSALCKNMSIDVKLPTDNPRLESAKVGRNETCPCGSGKKYKKCCLTKVVLPR